VQAAALPKPANRVLAALPANQYRRLSPHLEHVEVKLGQVLYERDAAVEHVYFPNDAMVSLVAQADGGDGVEVGLIGRDSMVGMQLVLGSATSPVRTLVQGAGSVMRMSAGRFLAELKRDATLRRLVERRIYVSMSTAMQIAVCNKAHLLSARLARWLLMVRDRLALNEFPLTQEFLANMLGVRRAGVTEAASALQERKLISYKRGRIRILDVEALRTAACSCYGVIRKLEKDSN
jgi:CRP-like cAMP-binding protein